MDVDDEDDFYGDGDQPQTTTEQTLKTEAKPETTEKAVNEDEDLEEGEEEDEEDSDSV